MNQYAQRHNFDRVSPKEPLYFASVQKAIEHLEGCGYWSNPIQFNTQGANQYFFSRYIAIDWSEEGSVHYRKK